MLIKDNRPKENHLRKGDKRFKMIRIDWKCGKQRGGCRSSLCQNSTCKGDGAPGYRQTLWCLTDLSTRIVSAS